MKVNKVLFVLFLIVLGVGVGFSYDFDTDVNVEFEFDYVALQNGSLLVLIDGQDNIVCNDGECMLKETIDVTSQVDQACGVLLDDFVNCTDDLGAFEIRLQNISATIMKECSPVDQDWLVNKFDMMMDEWKPAFALTTAAEVLKTYHNATNCTVQLAVCMARSDSYDASIASERANCDRNIGLAENASTQWMFMTIAVGGLLLAIVSGIIDLTNIGKFKNPFKKKEKPPEKEFDFD